MPERSTDRWRGHAHGGWLLRDGEVLASVATPGGWRGRVVSPREFSRGVGAIVVNGPAVVWGTPVAREGDASHLRALSRRIPLHVVGPGRTALAVAPDLAGSLTAGDELHIRDAS